MVEKRKPIFYDVLFAVDTSALSAAINKLISDYKNQKVEFEFGPMQLSTYYKSVEVTSTSINQIVTNIIPLPRGSAFIKEVTIWRTE